VETLWQYISGSGEVEAAFRLVLAIVLAGALGLERESRGRPAGLRTHILVCLGATLLMIVSEFIAQEFAETAGQTWLDRGRIAAGIITGIGFLGAGTIVNTPNEQRGLTTAAMIWFVASLGIAIGAGYYVISVLATVLALSIVMGLRVLEFNLRAHDHFMLFITLPADKLDLEAVKASLTGAGCYRANPLRVCFRDTDIVDLTFVVDSRTEKQFHNLVDVLRKRFPELTRLELQRR